MTDETETPETDKPATVGLIRQIVHEVLGEANTKVNEDTETRKAGRRVLNSRLDRDSEIEDKIAAAVGQIKEQEDRKRKEEDTHGRLSAVEEKVKDKPPVERTWAHKLMGWGD